VFEGNLHLVVRSVGDAKVLWHGYLNLATGDFSGWRNVPGASDNTPALAACSSQGCLILSVKGLDNAIYLNQWKDNTWSGWNALASGLTFDGPAGTCTGNVLQVVVRGIDGYSLWHCSYNVDSQVQLNWSLIEGSTPSTPKMTS
jgi:hypothetical protein